MAFDPGPAYVLGADGLSALFQALLDAEYTVVAPTARDGVIALAELGAAAALPAGKTDEQQPGSYRLKDRPDGAFFGQTVGPHAPKRWLLPPSFLRFRAHREKSGFRLEKGDTTAPSYG